MGTARIKFATSNLQEQFNSELLTISFQSLTGVLQARCKDYLGVDNVFLSFVKSYRQSIMTLQRLIKGKNLKPPYLMLGVTGISIRKDIINTKAAARSGIPVGQVFANVDNPAGVDHSKWIHMFHPVPVAVDIVFTYVDSDVARIMHFVTFLSSSLTNNLLTHTVDYEDLPQFEVQVNADAPGFQTGKDDWIDFDTEGSEGLQTVEIPGRMTSYVGYTSKKPMVRADGIELNVVFGSNLTNPVPVSVY